MTAIFVAGSRFGLIVLSSLRGLLSSRGTPPKSTGTVPESFHFFDHRIFQLGPGCAHFRGVPRDVFGTDSRPGRFRRLGELCERGIHHRLAHQSIRATRIPGMKVDFGECET